MWKQYNLFIYEVLRKDIDIAIEILSDALICPAFKASTFETEKNSQVAGLMEADDEILEFGFRKMRELLARIPFRLALKAEFKIYRSLKFNQSTASIRNL